jgi:hypothetical protein
VIDFVSVVFVEWESEEDDGLFVIGDWVLVYTRFSFLR